MDKKRPLYGEGGKYGPWGGRIWVHTNRDGIGIIDRSAQALEQSTVEGILRVEADKVGIARPDTTDPQRRSIFHSVIAFKRSMAKRICPWV